MKEQHRIYSLLINKNLTICGKNKNRSDAFLVSGAYVVSIFIVFSRPFFSKPDQQARFLVCRPPSFSLCLLDKNLFPNK